MSDQPQTVVPDAVVRLVGELQIRLALALEQLQTQAPKPDDPSDA